MRFCISESLSSKRAEPEAPLRALFLPFWRAGFSSWLAKAILDTIEEEPEAEAAEVPPTNKDHLGSSFSAS